MSGKPVKLKNAVVAVTGGARGIGLAIAEAMRAEGARICLVIAVSTLLVLATTALVVDRVYRYELARAARKQAQHD